jgi:integrase
MATVRKYRNRWVADFRDQHGKRRIEVPQGVFESSAHEKRMAYELLRQRLSEVGTQTYQPHSAELAFRVVAERWFDNKVGIRETTRSDYRLQLDCYLLPYFGSRKVTSISRLDIETFRAEMAKGVPASIKAARDALIREFESQGRKPPKSLKPGVRTTNKCLSSVYAILKYALLHGFVARNVAQQIDKLPAVTGSEAAVIEGNVLAPSELVRVLEHSDEHHWVAIALAIYCGLRQAEVLGLQWSDIDWDNGRAEIRRQQRRGKFWATKTRSSRRFVELPPALMNRLLEWKTKCPPSERSLICPSITGLPMQGSALLRDGFYPALERAQIRRVRYHDLRHSFASNLLANGVDIVTVSKALGHANVTITLSTYAHAVPKARQGASDRMAVLLAASTALSQAATQI